MGTCEVLGSGLPPAPWAAAVTALILSCEGSCVLRLDNLLVVDWVPAPHTCR